MRNPRERETQKNVEPKATRNRRECQIDVVYCRHNSIKCLTAGSQNKMVDNCVSSWKIEACDLHGISDKKKKEQDLRSFWKALKLP